MGVFPGMSVVCSSPHFPFKSYDYICLCVMFAMLFFIQFIFLTSVDVFVKHLNKNLENALVSCI